MPDVSRLPKWAQADIATLKNKIAGLEANLAERDEWIESRHPGSNTAIHDGIDQIRPLPASSTVMFYLGEPGDRWRSITARIDSYGRLRIATYGGNSVLVEPCASNSFYIKLGDH